VGYGEWLAVPLFVIACQKSFLWRRGTDRPAGRLRFISPPPTPRCLPPKARSIGLGLRTSLGCASLRASLADRGGKTLPLSSASAIEREPRDVLGAESQTRLGRIDEKNGKIAGVWRRPRGCKGSSRTSLEDQPGRYSPRFALEPAITDAASCMRGRAGQRPS